MNRPAFALWILSSMGWLTAIVGPISTAAPPLNVVYILSDDQAWGDYSFLDHPVIQTPRLDQLARESLTFTRGYTPTSLCRPSLATIISGLYPHQHGIVGNDPPWLGNDSGERKPPYNQPKYVTARMQHLRHAETMPSIVKMLAEKGYRTLQTGKWWEGDPKRFGFSEAMTIGDFNRGGRHGDVGLEIGRMGMEPIEKFLDQAATDRVPFFLWYAPMMPHTPHDPPQRLLDKYVPLTDSVPMAKYYAMCEWFDETCGQLLDMLDAKSLAENTLVVYVTDNGWINLPDQSAYAPRSKRSPNEGGTRTPILFRLPGVLKPRLNQSDLASTIDIVPTTLRLLNIPIPASLPGVDLSEPRNVDARKTVFGEIFEHDIVSMDEPADSLLYRWVIDGDMKLIEPASRLPREKGQLYDLKSDPAEDVDLSDEKPEEVSRLERLLDQWWHPATS